MRIDLVYSVWLAFLVELMNFCRYLERKLRQWKITNNVVLNSAIEKKRISRDQKLSMWRLSLENEARKKRVSLRDTLSFYRFLSSHHRLYHSLSLSPILFLYSSLSLSPYSICLVRLRRENTHLRVAEDRQKSGKISIKTTHVFCSAERLKPAFH